MASINKITVGQTLYAVRLRQMGNTTVRIKELTEFTVTEIDPDKQWVKARWFGNPPHEFRRRVVNGWRVKKPQPKGEIFGRTTY